MQTALPPPPFSATPTARGREDAHPTIKAPTAPIHLQRLQFVQAVCENQVGSPSVLTIADVRLAMHGLEQYFAPLFGHYRLTLSEVRETLLWAAGAFPCPTLVLDDIIHVLLTRMMEEQYANRLLTKGGGA
jgi:hypothetical protein